MLFDNFESMLGKLGMRNLVQVSVVFFDKLSVMWIVER